MKVKIIVVGILSVLLLTAHSAAEESMKTKSFNQIAKMSEKELREFAKSDCTTITYGGVPEATLCPIAQPQGNTPPEPTPSPPPEPSPAPTPSPTTSGIPSDVLDIKNWTLMLPAGSQGDPDNIYPTGYKSDYFFVRDGAVVFKTPANGVHSPNSQYPRTELREMKDDKWTKAAWSNKSGTHSLSARIAATHNLVAKPEVSIMQIHDGSDDVCQIRVQRGKIEVWWNDGNNKAVLDENYQLGSAHDYKLVAANSKIDVYYDGTLKTSINKSGSGWYFKLGNYLQSNPSKGEAPDATSEVTVYNMELKHL